jgi:ABC-type transport system involved in multi-copper enzyme maturation permease subunit
LIGIGSIFVQIAAIPSRFDPIGLLGPIVDKELRVASRRVRYYLLRMVFVGIIGLLVIFSWLASYRGVGSMALQSSRMSVISITVTSTVIGFLFFAVPFLAAVMMSNSISDEVRRGTLAVLMTTPITSVQLVIGKLLSRLLHLLLLTAIALPLLSILRLLGGVPWEAVLPGIVLTMTTAILAGSVSLWFSVTARQAHQALSMTIGVFFLVYLASVLLVQLGPTLISNGFLPKWCAGLGQILALFDPYSAFFSAMINSRMPVAGGPSWVMHCPISLAMSAAILGSACIRLRKVMIRQAFDPNRVGVVGKALGAGRPGPIRQVGEPPITWKDLHSTLRERGWLERFTAPLAIVMLLLTYFLAWKYDGLDYVGFHVAFVAILILLGLLRTTTLAGMTIAREKESRSLPILLMVPLSDTQILWQKVRAILHKTAPIWLILAGHVIIFSATGPLSPWSLPVLAVILLPTLIFMFGLGLFFSARCRSTTAATSWSFAVPMLMWFFNPFMVICNPIVLACVALAAMSQEKDSFPQAYIWGLAIIVLVAYIGIGFVLMIAGNRMMRSRMFESRG